MNMLNTLNSGSISKQITHVHIRRGFLFGVIILTALVAFEIFNYSTTDYALSDVLGNLKFVGIRWSTILAIAFCGIDFAGIARMFSPDRDGEDTGSTWYLFGAWMLAATMNAILTWWGVSMAIVNHPLESSMVVSTDTLLKVVPVFVSVMVWLIRILLIGSLSYSSDRLFGAAERRINHSTQRSRMEHPLAAHTMSNVNNVPNPIRSASPSAHPSNVPTPAPVRPAAALRPSPKPVAHPANTFSHPEPTYHSISMRSSETASREISDPPRA